MTLHVAGTEPKKSGPVIEIHEKASPLLVASIFFGANILMVILALRFPFFRYLFTFATVIQAITWALVGYGLTKDLDNGVKRPRPKGHTLNLPGWSQCFFFLPVIIISAGLRLGFYVTPFCWLIIWVAFEYSRQTLRKQWEDS